jgi:hypothetical protein
MMIKNPPKYYYIDRDVYEDLLISIDTSNDLFSLFIAVSDDNALRNAIIKKYESDLKPEIISYQLNLPIEKPSLEEVITKLMLEDIYLQGRAKAVFTVNCIEELNFTNKTSGRSQQDTFLSYLQWTRENFKRFPYPVVIWVDNALLEKLARKAPDFWSWRKGVFRFLPDQNMLNSESPGRFSQEPCEGVDMPLQLTSNDTKLSWEETYRAMALEDENWTDFDVVLLEGLEDDSFDTETL